MPDSVIDIIQAQNEMLAHQYVFTLWPLRWTTYSEMHEWHLFRLADSEIGNIPDAPGIYTLACTPRDCESSAMFVSDVCWADNLIA